MAIDVPRADIQEPAAEATSGQCLQQVQRAEHVDLQRGLGIAHRIRHRALHREMDHGVRTGSLDQRPSRLRVTKIQAVRNVGELPCARMRRRDAVREDGAYEPVSARDQQPSHESSPVPGSARPKGPLTTPHGMNAGEFCASPAVRIQSHGRRIDAAEGQCTGGRGGSTNFEIGLTVARAGVLASRSPVRAAEWPSPAGSSEGRTAMSQAGRFVAHAAPRTAARAPTATHPRSPGWLAPAAIAAAAGIAYHNSFSGPFVFDDLDSIVENPSIRQLWPPFDVLAGTSRPVVAVTLAANYALGGLAVHGYHAVNLAIHLLAALTLLAILRRTFAGPRLGERYGSVSNGLALAAAALWVVHPLNTQAVAYVIQRAESLAGLLYLLTLYGTIRGASSVRHAGPWYALAATSCALGAATKPLVVSAPIVVLLYDRFFLADSFRAALRRRGALYGALAASWGLMMGLAVVAPDSAAGFHLERVSPLAYAATQPGVVWHYLRLALWPDPLVLDYGWPLAKDAAGIVLPALALMGIAGAALREALRLRPIGFVCLWFLLVLAPSSSVFPIHDPAFEHRMYLPLVAPVVLTVVAGHELLARRGRFRKATTALAILGVAAGCGLTIRRNRDYRSEIAIWSDVVAKRPGNARGHNNLGRALLRVHDTGGAMPHLRNAVRLAPDYPEAHNNLGAALAERNRLEEAIVEFRDALTLKPELVEARKNLARAFLRQSRFSESIGQYQALLRLQPSNAPAWEGLGDAFSGARNFEEAIRSYREAVRLDSGLAVAHNNLGLALAGG